MLKAALWAVQTAGQMEYLLVGMLGVLLVAVRAGRMELLWAAMLAGQRVRWKAVPMAV